ncbi:HlyD family secretion protein [Marinospirillum celere]|uniref:HlyD family secretion protein n=1 Tax=Marinospirillum celere TaxID=1122252 RepID=A0A1I1EGJ8_9GAMM|nr:HlyD family efflux transporter periplasmic adaptor subunit [Marinospirillum celere]SFB84478.1 HlyD family secretion protein [Marinospirillum celere]
MPALLKRFLPFLIILLALLGFVLLRMTRPEPPAAGDEERRWPITVVEIQAGDYAPSLRVFGELTSNTDAQLRARAAGDVQEIHVREGQRVAEGDLLITLDDLDARALYQQREAEMADISAQLEQLQSQHRVDRQALDQEEAMLLLTERQYERLRQLLATNRASQREVDEAQLALAQQRLAVINRELAIEQFTSRQQQLKSNLQRAETQLAMARRDLEATRLKAPVDLRVQEIQVSRGDRVAANEPLVSVFVPEQVELLARLPVSRLATLRSALDQGLTLKAETQVDGQTLIFELQELAGRTQDTAGIKAVFSLLEGDPEGLALGRFIDANLALPVEKGVYWLPADAVQGRNRVYRVLDERLEGLNVEALGQLLVDGQPGVLVRSEELTSGDRVMTNRLPNAMTGLLVEAVE